MSLPLPQQANACEVAVRILGGAVSPSKKEKDFLVERLRDAGVTLRWLERNERVIREAVKAKGGA